MMKRTAGVERAFPGPGMALLLVLAVLVVQGACGFCIGMGLMLHRNTGTGGAGPLIVPPVALLAMNLLAFGVVSAWAAWMTRGCWRAVLAGGRGTAVVWIAAVPLLLGATVLVSEASNLLQLAWAGGPVALDLFSGLMDVEAHPVVSVLTVVILAPVAEEYLLRGVILRGLLEHLRPWPAVWLTTGLFTVMHANLWQVPVGLGLGLVCGWVYRRTRSLALCILLHGVNNAVALFSRYLPCSIPGVTGDGAVPALHPWWLDVAGVALVGLGGWAFARTTRGLLRPPPLPAPEASPESTGSGEAAPTAGGPSGSREALSKT